MTRLARLLDPRPEPAVVDRTWDAIAARLPGRRRRTPIALGLAAFATAALVTIMLRTSAPAPFALAGGAAIPAELSGVTRFSDGSTVVVARGELELIESSPGVVHLLLAAGDARFSIVPGGPRKWTIDAGLAQVEVVGTELSVTRDQSGVTVAVSHGIVVVRGERVPGLVRRLRAGESLRVAAGAPGEKTAAPDAGPTAPDTAPPRATALADADPRATIVDADTQPSTARAPLLDADLPRTSRAPIAVAVPTRTDGTPLADADVTRTSRAPTGEATSASRPSLIDPAPRSAPPADGSPTSRALLAGADAQRTAGDLAAAAATLDRVRDDATDPLAAIARFTRARILLDLGRRGEAVRDLHRAIANGLPAALEARARARLLELEDPAR